MERSSQFGKRLSRSPVAILRLASLIYALSPACLFAQQVASDDAKIPQILEGEFRWNFGPPLLSAEPRQLPDSPEHPWIAVKDPSIIQHDGRWHLFCTLRKQKQGNGRIAIGHLAFDEWSQAKLAKWSVLKLTDDYHGAPQVFFFEPQQKWYLIYQAVDPSRDLKYGPCFSTNQDIGDPNGWSLPQPLYVVKEGAKGGLDYWVICDETNAYLFFTSLDGRMWRAETLLSNFPNRGWTTPIVVLEADIFEASHTYRLLGTGKYLTFVEAQHQQSRYFKAYVADTLDGQWQPLADSRDRPFVSPVNVIHQSESWATSYSHGELIRTSANQRMEVDPTDLQLLFQGASDEEVARGDYGSIPWRLGLLRLEYAAE